MGVLRGKFASCRSGAFSRAAEIGWDDTSRELPGIAGSDRVCQQTPEDSIAINGCKTAQSKQRLPTANFHVAGKPAARDIAELFLNQ